MKPIDTGRLQLIPATLAMVSADLHRREELPRLLQAQLGTDWPPPLISVEVMQRLKRAMADEPDHDGWSTWYVIQKEPRLVIGLSGFKSRPQNGAVELGYTLLPMAHGKGLGRELVGGLTEWAFSHRDVDLVYAETLPELLASQRVLERNAFQRVPSGSEPGVVRFEKRKG